MSTVVDYTIAAIPTVYNGRQYRSRLEARWATFFDLCGWTHEYEPYDLGKWSPDFLLHVEDGDYLVEVKPISDFDQETAAKMHLAVRDARISGTYLGALLVGTAPVVRRVKHGDAARLGYCNPYCGTSDNWREMYKCWAMGGGEPRLFSVLATRNELDTYDGVDPYVDYTMRLWAHASNSVQYMRPETVG